MTRIIDASEIIKELAGDIELFGGAHYAMLLYSFQSFQIQGKTYFKEVAWDYMLTNKPLKKGGREDISRIEHTTLENTLSKLIETHNLTEQDILKKKDV